jgi:hypothetical protein
MLGGFLAMRLKERQGSNAEGASDCDKHLKKSTRLAAMSVSQLFARPPYHNGLDPEELRLSGRAHYEATG